MIRSVDGIPPGIMNEIDFMFGSIEECNSEYMLPILLEHGIDPDGSWIDIEKVPEDVIIDVYERLFKTGELSVFYTKQT